MRMKCQHFRHCNRSASMQYLHNRFAIVKQVGIRHVGRFEAKLSNMEMSTFSGTATRASRCKAYIIVLLLRSKLELDTCTLKMRGYKELLVVTTSNNICCFLNFIFHIFQCWLIRLIPTARLKMCSSLLSLSSVKIGCSSHLLMD